MGCFLMNHSAYIVTKKKGIKEFGGALTLTNLKVGCSSNLLYVEAQISVIRISTISDRF